MARDTILSDKERGTLELLLGWPLGTDDIYIEALTHGSYGSKSYERLEFLGDRVLGLVIADALFSRFSEEPEGKLSSRLNALVSGELCAEIARENGVATLMRLGKQARDDGGHDSDNILGDVMEALIGAVYRERGLEEARAFILRLWGERLEKQLSAPKHPKSALQEWAAAHQRRSPNYQVVSRDGPHHAPRFTVSVAIHKLAEASASGSSKQEAETEAARALLAQLNEMDLKR